MTASSRPLIHIGMAKAASTFLQRELFPHLDGYHNLGKHEVSAEEKNALMAITRRVSLTWYPNQDKLCAPLKNSLATARERALRPVVSDEDFSVYKFLDPEIMARRLRDIFGDHDVLFVVREPFDWLESQYLFRLQHQNPIAVFGFEEWLDHHMRPQRIGSDIAEIWSASIADLYKQFCGGEIHVVEYEMLKHNPAAFAERLSEILEVDQSLVLDRLNAPKSKLAHKLRITADQMAVYETFRWIELRNPQRFIQEVEQLSVTLAPDARGQVQAELETCRDLAPLDRDSWRSTIQRIAAQWPDDAPLAHPVFPEDKQALIRQIRKRNAQRLRQKFGVSLSNWP